MANQSHLWNRREILAAGGLAGLACAVRPLAAVAGAPGIHLEDRMTPYPATWYRPYTSKPAASAQTPAWVQIDLGSAQDIEGIRLYPTFDLDIKNSGFPARMRVEASQSGSFESPVTLFDGTDTEIPEPGDRLSYVSLVGVPRRFRYVRITGTELRPLRKNESGVPVYGLSFAKVEVISSGRDIAVERPVTADPETGNPADLQQLTRKPRSLGEGIVTDNPDNVSDPKTWRRVANQAQTPIRGVEIGPGVCRAAMETNIEYLLTSFSVDEMLRPFRERAGKPVVAGLRPPVPFWDTDLPGSSAGRFLMGAANTVRWVDHEELHRRMNAIVAGIADCRQSNGYIMAYPEDSIFHSERAGYTRAWVTHGLLEAGYSGHPEAFELLRGYYDWFDTCPYLPRLLRGTPQGVQGMVANTRMYFSPQGKPVDLQVIQRYYQENFWLDGLARRDPAMVWQYPYDRPHNYLLTDIEAYLDLYRATGERRYGDAVRGAWDLYHDNWEHTGGSIAITEFGEFPPKSYRLNAQFDFCETGELCGSSFWAFLNQRLHLLDPEKEKYVTEIEKSIYNIGIANQADARGLFYHARLVGTKGDKAVGVNVNSCCEGQGTRLLGSIPEHIYSVVEDGSHPGLFVDLFAPSSVRWSQKDGASSGEELKLVMTTSFPENPQVTLKFELTHPRRSVIRVRTPSWAIGSMPILINGESAATGTPGSYILLDRTWKHGDVIAFTLPAGFRLTRYTGLDQIAGHARYALEYGPILMAIEGSDNAHLIARDRRPESFGDRLHPVSGQPLHFEVSANEPHRYVPYYSIKQGAFTCFPTIDFA